jgi:hypothetical protein
VPRPPPGPVEGWPSPSCNAGCQDLGPLSPVVLTRVTALRLWCCLLTVREQPPPTAATLTHLNMGVSHPEHTPRRASAGGGQSVGSADIAWASIVHAPLTFRIYVRCVLEIRFGALGHTHRGGSANDVFS